MHGGISFPYVPISCEQLRVTLALLVYYCFLWKNINKFILSFITLKLAFRVGLKLYFICIIVNCRLKVASTTFSLFNHDFVCLRESIFLHEKRSLKTLFLNTRPSVDHTTKQLYKSFLRFSP